MLTVNQRGRASNTFFGIAKHKASRITPAKRRHSSTPFRGMRWAINTASLGKGCPPGKIMKGISATQKEIEHISKVGRITVRGQFEKDGWSMRFDQSLCALQNRPFETIHVQLYEIHTIQTLQKPEDYRRDALFAATNPFRFTPRERKSGRRSLSPEATRLSIALISSN